MKLHEINNLLERILMLPDGNAVDIDTGEIFSEEELTNLSISRDEKVEGCLLFSKNEEALAKALKEESDKLLERAKACQGRAERAKKYAEYILNGEKFKTIKVAVSYRTSKKVEVTCDVNTLPDEYKSVTIDIKPKKMELRKAIESGTNIDGVTLIVNKTMVIK